MLDPLREAQSHLVRRWGELGGYWGINRTMAEIHALLFISGEELCTDDVMEQLHVSRGNASMNLRGLVDWGLIRRVHRPGDRKEYFQADTDIWHMFETIMRERRRREVEPIMATISRSREEVARLNPTDAQQRQRVESFSKRLGDLENFLQTMGTLFELLIAFGAEGVRGLIGAVPAAARGANNTGAGLQVGAPNAKRDGERAAPRRRMTRKVNR